jgi:hypothetical protein
MQLQGSPRRREARACHILSEDLLLVCAYRLRSELVGLGHPRRGSDTLSFLPARSLDSHARGDATF